MRYTVFLSTIDLPSMTKNRLRKNSKKKSSYASNKIEGNPLTEEQADEAIERDEHKHFLKPEQEIRNYFLALNLLEYSDIPELLDELVDYVNTTDDHPLIIAAVVHYQLVTIHPFEDGKNCIGQMNIISKVSSKIKRKILDIFLFQILLTV